MIVYKLTNQDCCTRGDTLWTPGKWRKTSGVGDLCGPGWLHFYSDPLVAVLLNPIHGAIASPRLWEAEAGGEMKADHGLKAGSTRLRVVREIPLPEITTEQRVRFAICCAWEVCHDVAWRSWAKSWLSGAGAGRSEPAANAAADAAWAAAKAAAARASWAAANAASAAWAATAAAWAAWAAESEAWAAESAARAAEAASNAAASPLDLPALARRAMEVTT